MIDRSAKWILATAIGLFASIVARDTNPIISNVANLEPWPDSAEYMLMAEALWLRFTPVLDLNGLPWPARYPPGTSILIAPIYGMFGRLETTAMAVPLVFGSALIVSCFLLATRLTTTIPALIFAYLVATSPMVLKLSSHVLSETILLSIVAIAALCFTDAVRTQRFTPLFALGLLLGLAIAIRTQAILLIGAFVLTIWLPKFRLDFRRFAVFSSPIMAFAVLLGGYNYFVYQGAALDGYSYHLGSGALAYSLKSISANVGLVKSLMMGEEIGVVGARIVPQSILISLLAIGGIWKTIKDHGHVWVGRFATFILLSTVPQLFYDFVDGRFYILLHLSALFFASQGMAWLAQVISRGSTAREIVALIGGLLICLFWPSGSTTSSYKFMTTHASRAWSGDKYLALETARKKAEEVSHRERKPVALYSDVYPPVAWRYLKGAALVYSLSRPPCWGPCIEKRADILTPLERTAQQRVIFLLDSDTPAQRFAEICAKLRREFVFERIYYPGHYRLFRLHRTTDGEHTPNQPC